jgi:hypothetical protein
MDVVLTVLPYLVGLALAAVAVTLFSGLFSMIKGGEFNRRHGNQLMRWRVATQAVAISLIVLYLLLSRM